MLEGSVVPICSKTKVLLLLLLFKNERIFVNAIISRSVCVTGDGCGAKLDFFSPSSFERLRPYTEKTIFPFPFTLNGI